MLLHESICGGVKRLPDLYGANLRLAYLTAVDLSGADLRYAYLADANLSNMIGTDALVCDGVMVRGATQVPCP